MDRRRLLIALVVLCVVGQAGCSAQWLASAIVAVPNAGRPIDPKDDPDPAELSRLGVDVQLRVNVGPPDASLSVWILEPHEPSTNGTVFVLHGSNDSKMSMIGLGRLLASADYRAVLVDLRGHGRSTGDWLSYGVFESRDLSQVIDDLDRRGLLERPIGVYGASYGGSVAVQAAGVDSRIDAVVAVAPFSSMRAIVPPYVRRFLPVIGRLMSDRSINHAIDDGGRTAGFNPDDADAGMAARKTHAQLLLIHGRSDRDVPYEHSVAIHDTAPDHSELLILDGATHESIFSGRHGDEVVHRAIAWFDRWLARRPPGP